jgi:hypothetical protein
MLKRIKKHIKPRKKPMENLRLKNLLEHRQPRLMMSLPRTVKMLYPLEAFTPRSNRYSRVLTQNKTVLFLVPQSRQTRQPVLYGLIQVKTLLLMQKELVSNGLRR